MGMTGKRILAGMLVVAGLVAPATMVSAQDTPSADEIFDSYLKAIGGESALKKVENRVMEGTFSLPAMGMEATMKTYIAPPNYYSEIVMDAFGTIKRGIADGVAWEINTMQGNRILEGEEKSEMKRQASLAEYANWKDHYESAEVLGEDTLGEEAVYKVELTPKGSASPTTVFFSKESGLIIGGEGTGPQGMPITSTIGDYKEVDGIKIPHSIENSGGQFDISITFTAVEHNADIPEGTFALPEEIKAVQGGGE